MSDDYSDLQIVSGEGRFITKDTKQIVVHYQGHKALGVIETTDHTGSDDTPLRFVIFDNGKALPIFPGSGKIAFELHDTRGFPVDLTRDEFYDNGWALDEREFFDCMEEQKAKSRKGSKMKKGVF